MLYTFADNTCQLLYEEKIWRSNFQDNAKLLDAIEALFLAIARQWGWSSEQVIGYFVADAIQKEFRNIYAQATKGDAKIQTFTPPEVSFPLCVKHFVESFAQLLCVGAPAKCNMQQPTTTLRLLASLYLSFL